MPGSRPKTADERGMHRLRLEAARNHPMMVPMGMGDTFPGTSAK
ncbi:MAG: hypothetical protein ACLSUW_04165 [Akkermansia sp.]